MKQLSDKAIRVLGNWWFDQFTAPTHDNGEKSTASLLAGRMMSMLADKHPVTEEQREPFILALIAECRSAIDGKSFYALALGTDYDPGGTLGKAMVAADIDKSRASIKTSVEVRGKGVDIAAGYGAPWELLCDLEGVEPTKRWVFETASNGRTCITYSYSEYAHHGQVAAANDYLEDGERGEERVEGLEDGKWRRLTLEACSTCGRT